MEKPEGCFLCEKPRENNDEANYILYRGQGNFILLNSYPYNPGHLMVAPYRHVASPAELTEEERNEHFDMVSRGVEVLRQVFNPGGFNTGMNLGRVAGAGVADHIHTHIVPRWVGDSNFMPVVADVRVIPEALAETYERLKGKF
jgi:ATP adenylyltransferase